MKFCKQHFCLIATTAFFYFIALYAAILTYSYKSAQNWEGKRTFIAVSTNVGAITKLGGQTMKFDVMPLIPILDHSH